MNKKQPAAVLETKPPFLVANKKTTGCVRGSKKINLQSKTGAGLPTRTSKNKGVIGHSINTAKTRLGFFGYITYSQSYSNRVNITNTFQESGCIPRSDPRLELPAAHRDASPP